MVIRVIGVLLLVVVVALIVAVAYRFVMFRGSGSPIVFTTSRPGAAARWQHGILRYTEDSALIIKLFSIRPAADVSLPRASIVLDVARMPSTETERELVEPDEVILPFSATDGRGHPISGSLALSNHSHAALRSWVEACSTQQIKGRRARFS